MHGDVKHTATDRGLIALGVLAALALLVPGTAIAQTAPLNNHLDSIVRLYRNNAGAWTGVLTTYAVRLFWLLAGIEFTFAAFGLAFKGADLGEWVSTIVNQVLFIGFFYTLLTHSSQWSQAIVDSFRTAANGATVPTQRSSEPVSGARPT